MLQNEGEGSNFHITQGRAFCVSFFILGVSKWIEMEVGDPWVCLLPGTSSPEWGNYCLHISFHTNWKVQEFWVLPIKNISLSTPTQISKFTIIISHISSCLNSASIPTISSYAKIIAVQLVKTFWDTLQSPFSNCNPYS